jgi:hypothetical protein
MKPSGGADRCPSVWAITADESATVAITATIALATKFRIGALLIEFILAGSPLD